MKRFSCSCGQPVFYDSKFCIRCHATLGFDPIHMTVLSEYQPGSGVFINQAGQEMTLCQNAIEHQSCNWLKLADDSNPLCMACQFNRTIVNLEKPGNLQRWQRFEQSKKRLFFSLLSLDLPLRNGWQDPYNGLLFDFIEDKRTNPFSMESFISTGYHGGIITINALEADDDAREAMRSQMNEVYRTLLGHLRHESGHYYWNLMQPDAQTQALFYDVFGDIQQDYGTALERYYENGPQEDWQSHFISAYASAHPSEDIAETWGHYLHIYDTLETAAAHGLAAYHPHEMDFAARISAWRELSITMNELNRSLGQVDAYPFVLTAEVEKKLAFIDLMVQSFQKFRSAETGYQMSL